MSENCMANCMASKIHLQLRNKIFYYRVELPRVNNKRRYKIISLHTQNYFEAQEKIKQMITQEEKFRRLRQLFGNLIFEGDDSTGIATLVTKFSGKRLAALARLILTISLVGKAKQPWSSRIPTIHLHKLRMKCKNSAMTFLNRLLRNGRKFSVYTILSINRLKVLRWTPSILAIWDLEMPLDSKFCTFLAFFESLSFFDSAENGRPSFLPEALRLARDDFVR